MKNYDKCSYCEREATVGIVFGDNPEAISSLTCDYHYKKHMNGKASNIIRSVDIEVVRDFVGAGE